MIEGSSIVCFAHDWGGDPTSKTHIMRILAKGNRVLWVNSIGMRRPSASGRDIRRIVTKLRRTIDGCVQVEPNIFVVNPLVLPLPGVAFAELLNAEILAAWLRHLCKRHKFRRPILWTFLPNAERLVGRLGERMVIYHCVDEYAAFSGVPRAALQRMERDLLRKADLVFTSSEQLCRERRKHNPHTFFVSHGVDVNHFSLALDPDTCIPADMAGIPSPVIGFFGLLADWVDLDLIRQMALARPGWTFVLVGKPATDLAGISGVPNIQLIGQKPYETLPGYCRAFDVGLVPFKVNELTLKANPLKLREYLAAGLPVVSTDLPEVRKYAGLVRLATGMEDFLEQIETALGERGHPDATRRVAAMQAEGWERRVEELSALIAAHEVARGV